jgi:hypothetical protein
MSVTRRSPARPWLVFAGATTITLAVMIVCGLQQIAVRTVSLGVPNTERVAVVKPGALVCQGPITSPSAAGTVEVWGQPTSGDPQTTVMVRSVSGRGVISEGLLEPSSGSRPRAPFSPPTTAALFGYQARLNRNIPGGRSVEVCVQAKHGSFALQGWLALAPGVTMTGGTAGLQFSLVLLKPGGSTLLGSLPTAFARASLFKLSWLHPWVFWLLCALLLATILFGSFAIGAAVREEVLDEGVQAPPPAPTSISRDVSS